jgi:hypothetical protein
MARVSRRDVRRMVWATPLTPPTRTPATMPSAILPPTEHPPTMSPPTSNEIAQTCQYSVGFHRRYQRTRPLLVVIVSIMPKLSGLLDLIPDL